MAFRELFGEVLLTKDGEKPTSDVLSGATAVGIYFSAHWCPPCRGFTPMLVEMFQGAFEAKGMKIVFVSSDKDESSFNTYYGEMPWAALPYSSGDVSRALSKKFGVQGIPSLTIIDGEGKTITVEGRSAVMGDPAGDKFPWTSPTPAAKAKEDLLGADLVPMSLVGQIVAGDIVVAAKPVRVVANTMQGATLELEVAADSTIAVLKEQLALLLPGDIQPYQLFLMLGDTKLQDASVVKDAAFDKAAVTVVVGPKVPSWAQERGLDPQHPTWLREHYNKYGLDEPDWFSTDAEIWQALKDGLDAWQEYQGYGHRLHFEVDGAPAGQLRAAPGARVEVAVRARVWNAARGNTCIQQLGLAVGPLSGCAPVCLSEIYNGVPSTAQDISRRISFDAPTEKGAHMLWRFNDLQYSFEAALNNFRNKNVEVTPKYPSHFVGWLIVE